MYDDGLHGDGSAGDKTFATSVREAPGIPYVFANSAASSSLPKI